MYIDSCEELCEPMRKNINIKLESNLIPRRMSIENLKEVDNLLGDFLFTQMQQGTIGNIDYGDIRYQVIEKGLTYQYQ